MVDDGMYDELEMLRADNKKMREALESIAATHINLDFIENDSQESLFMTVCNDTDLAREVLKEIDERK